MKYGSSITTCLIIYRKNLLGEATKAINSEDYLIKSSERKKLSPTKSRRREATSEEEAKK